MNKAELVAAMAETSGLSRKDCETALAAFTEVVEKALQADDKVKLVGFGAFELSARSSPASSRRASQLPA